MLRSPIENTHAPQSAGLRLTKATVLLSLHTKRVGLRNLVIVNSSLEVLFPLQVVRLHVHSTARLYRETHQQPIIIYRITG